MDLDNQNKNRSKQRNKNQKQITKGDDRISKLPDPLFHHILSFLPTKFAACTSILSKRWRNVWVFSPVLDFRNWWSDNVNRKDYPLHTEIFMNCVDKMLCFQDDMPNLKKLYLEIDNYFDEARVNAWFSIFVRRKIEELNIDLSSREYDFTLPPCLFTSESSTMMTLEMSYDVQLPESIYFPRLRILLHSCMVFVDDDSTEQLFSNCPVLEELILCHCHLECLKVLSISAPALKCLSIDGASENDCSVNIYAPSLVSLKYVEHVAKDFDLHGFPLLIDADIGFSIYIKVYQKQVMLQENLLESFLMLSF